MCVSLQAMAFTVLSVLGMVAFVCIKEEMVLDESDAETEESVAISADRSGVQRILLSYVSVLASVGDMKAKGPALLREITGWAGTASGGVSVGLYYVKCALGWDFYTRLWGGLFLPLLCVLLCAIYSYVRGVFKESGRLSVTFLVGCSVMVVFLAFPAQIKDLLLGTYLIGPPF